MFTDRVKNKFSESEPIFTEELIDLFSDYSRVQVFRMIDGAKENGELLQYSKGIYYIPHLTKYGLFPLTADDVIKKRYIKNKNEIYGIYSGLKLMNTFSVTTQMAGVIEIVTNNESSKCREIQINNRRYVLRRSRCRIDSSNAAAYTVIQLLNDMDKCDSIDETVAVKLRKYIEREKITKEQLLAISCVFPAKTTKKLVESGILNDIA